MVDKRGDTIVMESIGEVRVHRSVQDVWRAENAAWRARVLAQLRQAGPVEDGHPRAV